MLSTRVIVCLDVHNGRTVKGINFINLKDAGDPVEQAKQYSIIGADEICFLDISATNEKRRAMFNVISKTAESCFVPLTVGGGVNNLSDFRDLLNSGADKVSINSSAVYNPTLIRQSSDKFGNQCVVLAIDAIENEKMPCGYEVTTHGGRKKTNMDVLRWAKKGVKIMTPILLKKIEKFYLFKSQKFFLRPDGHFFGISGDPFFTYSLEV